MRCMWSLVGLGMCIWSVATLLGRSTGHLKVVHLKGKGRDNSKVSYLSTTPANLLEFEIAPGNTGNVLEFSCDAPGKFL